MSKSMSRVLPLALFALILAAVAPPPERGRAMAVGDHELISQAGASILAKGGNAVDAAVASALAAGVVQPSSSGLGGGGFAVVSMSGKTHVLDFREMAPESAHRTMYEGRDGAVFRN